LHDAGGGVPVGPLENVRDLVNHHVREKLRRRALEKMDPRRAQIVEPRFFGGLSVEEAVAGLAVERTERLRY
jgi:hypothetical protein